MSPTRRRIKVAAAQLQGLPLKSAGLALEGIERAIDSAASAGVDLLVLPECAYPAYCLGSAEAYRQSGVLDSEAFVHHLSELASRHGVNLVCGFVEDCGSHLHNTAVVIDANGTECGRRRKTFLWGDDNTWFTPGDSIAPIDTPLGKIGVLICAEGRAPEVAAGLVAQGAQLIALPTCWVNVAKQPGQYKNAQAEFMIAGRAMELGVPIVAANKFGQETKDVSYCGLSVILDKKGSVLAQAPPDAPALIEATLSLSAAHDVAIPEWAQRRILADYPPVLPSTEELEPVKVAVVPACLVSPLHADADGDLFQKLAADGVKVVGTSFRRANDAERMEVYGRALGMTVVGYPFVERLMIERFGAYGCVGTDGIRSFVPARVMALDGASIIFVAGDDVPLPLLRTRAAENRVFVAAARSKQAVLIDPDGQVIDVCEAAEPRPVVATVDLALSADKLVYSRTHIWDQRRPAAYAKAFGIQARPSAALRGV